MKPVIGVVIIVIGILLMIVRHSFVRLGRRLLSRWYGPAVGEEAMDPSATPRPIFIVGIGFILFGGFILFESLFAG